MRYLGNKRHLLGDIEAAARSLGFTKGTVCDLFAGSARVGRHFRALGSKVVATDLMHSSYVLQQAHLELDGPPSFDTLLREVETPEPLGDDSIGHALPADPESWLPTRRVLAHLLALPPREGLLTRQYSPAGSMDRRYLRPENAAQADAILATLREWREREWIASPEFALLLATTIDAVDRVANISGTYGAFLKKWQANAEQPLRLKLPALVEGPVGEAHREDALEWIGGVTADLLYMDPPYNQRQYPANYHLLEVIARIPTEPDLSSFEDSIYGKTGLVPWRDKASVLCSRRGTECRDAFWEILRRTTIPRVVVSYSEEGIISRDEFEEMLAEYAGVSRARLGHVLTEIPYKRFRSDADGRVSSIGTSRQYKELPGRGRNEVHEWLFSVAKRADVSVGSTEGA